MQILLVVPPATILAILAFAAASVINLGCDAPIAASSAAFERQHAAACSVSSTLSSCSATHAAPPSAEN